MLNVDNKTTRSYATRANLEAALVKFGFANNRPLIVCNSAGRFTAIFGVHLSGLAKDGDMCRFANQGFITID